jgi:hypothetical protein
MRTYLPKRTEDKPNAVWRCPRDSKGENDEVAYPHARKVHPCRRLSPSPRPGYMHGRFLRPHRFVLRCRHNLSQNVLITGISFTHNEPIRISMPP